MKIALGKFTDQFNLDLSRIDLGFIFALMSLVGFGLVMVASSSVDFANARYGDEWMLFRRQCIFVALGLALGTVVVFIPLTVWERYSAVFLLLAIALLIAVLIPGVGKVVNGSRRWLPLGAFTMQASELAKICLLLFFSSYLARRQHEVQGSWRAFFVMIFVIGMVVVLLLLEPDFGSAFVISFTLASMMFVAGVPILRFFLVALCALGLFGSMAVFSPYRWERLVAFMDPWSRQFDSGYQLVQSLIAFGRGEWFGLGLGNSLQKLFFLPEAHTDFIFSIIAEEFGFIGALAVVSVFVFLIAKILLVAKTSNQNGKLFNAYLCLGVALIVGAQAFINMGVASGLLPTKGLTLPFISYGGSSFLICSILIALVIRAHMESRYAD